MKGQAMAAEGVDRVAPVTGAARGIGRAIAADLAADRRVAVTCRSSDPSDLLAAHPGIHAIAADFLDEAAADRAMAAAMAQFGWLAVLILNAGAVAQTPAEAPDMGAHRAVLDVNYPANVALLGAALPHLGQGAAVVAISSMNAVLPPRGAVTYGASKAALNLSVRGMAKELGRPGAPQDVAAALRFLASDAAVFIAAEVLGVSGGYRL
jgi:3-oxoacyl-[acyl-carrier protein] reductase